ncbi:hypothetical protein [Mycobacterium sp. NAZ190054]|nr:hypothetical protein [Mycobacterium sp. NAZ190054]
MAEALMLVAVFVASATAGIFVTLLAVNVALVLRLRSRIPQEPPVDTVSG